VSSPYRIPDPPQRYDTTLDVSPAVVVLTVAAVVAVVLFSHERPSPQSMDCGTGAFHAHSSGAHAGRPHGR
jgi:hypothetical protein